MNWDWNLVSTLVVLGAAMVVFLSERLRPDLVALATVAALAGAGVLTAGEAFSGFSSPAVMTLIAVFIMAEGLNRTGVADQVGRLLLRWGGRKEGRLVALVMAAGAGLSLFMNNIASAAVLLPAVSGAARRAKVPASKVLMPLAFATILGGMATLLTTMNIVVGSVLQEQGYPGFGLLDFLPVGGPMLLVGIGYMVVWGRHRLPVRRGKEALVRSAQEQSDLLDIYRMGESFFRARIPAGSYLVGRTLAESTFREAFGLNVVAVERSDGRLLLPVPETVFEPGDVVVLEGSEEEFRQRDREPYLEILCRRPLRADDLETASTVIAEAMLAPRSGLIGQSLKEVHFRRKFGMTALAIWRAGQPIRSGVADEPLAFGDALLLQGPRSRLDVLEAEPGLILLTLDREPPPVQRLGKVALLILAATLAVVAATPLPVAQVMLTGAVVMALAGAVTMDQAYRAVDWKGIFLVAGMLSLALAMSKSGAADLASAGLLATFGRLSPLVITAALFMVSALLTQAVSGAAVAAMMAPVAVAVGVGSGVSPQALGMAVALGSSMAFLTPLGHPVNTLVMGAGDYYFKDYLRAGWPLFVVLTAVAVVSLALRYSLF